MNSGPENSRVSFKAASPKRGIPLTADEPRTLADVFRRGSEKFARRDALSFKKDGEWVEISSSEMIERIENIAVGLHSLGLCKGDHAAILAANSPEWTLADGGCQFAGIVDIPIYTTLSESSVDYILTDSRPRVIFLQDLATYERIKQAVTKCGSIEKLVFFSHEETVMENAISLTELERIGGELKRSNPELVQTLIESVEPDDIATLIYTSGTTGEPKGVMLSHTNIISNAIDAGEK
ncbi:MAG: AMP-binding protein, partial [Pyrinomonadaceae bacterium]